MVIVSVPEDRTTDPQAENKEKKQSDDPSSLTDTPSLERQHSPRAFFFSLTGTDSRLYWRQRIQSFFNQPEKFS